MSRFNVRIQLAHLLPAAGAVNGGTFPQLALAVRKVTAHGQKIWQAYASGSPLPGGGKINARSGAYMRSILTRNTGDFASEIYSDLPYAKSLEVGTPARDMKTMLDTSHKVRVSKKGKRYLIIPFRHGTPGTVGFRSAMPTGAHELAKGLEGSRITGVGKRPSGHGAYDIRTRSPHMVAQRQYKWGGRLNESDLRSAGVGGSQLRNMTGMVKMHNIAGRHTGYMTFRVMVEGSSGWIAKARPGLYPARTTAERLKPIAERLFAAAVQRDIENSLGL